MKIKCPACGHSGVVYVHALTEYELDEVTERITLVSQPCWGHNDLATCPECDTEGEVRDFIVKED